MAKRGISGIFYGTEGVGKTSFALQFKKDLICGSIRGENGYNNLELVGDIPDGCDNEEIDSYQELIKFIRAAKDYSTLVLDSMSGMQQIIADQIIKDHYTPSPSQKMTSEQAFASFSEGFRVHAPFYADEICSELTLLNTRGVNTILLGHAKLETSSNPFGADYETTVIDMEKWPRAVFKKWAGAILYMTLDVEVMVTKDWKGKPTEAKATASVDGLSDRIMYTTKHLSHEAKNLYKLPPFISLGESAEEAFENFYKKLPPNLQEAVK